jgi:hypothetical protein
MAPLKKPTQEQLTLLFLGSFGYGYTVHFVKAMPELQFKSRKGSILPDFAHHIRIT